MEGLKERRGPGQGPLYYFKIVLPGPGTGTPTLAGTTPAAETGAPPRPDAVPPRPRALVSTSAGPGNALTFLPRPGAWHSGSSASHFEFARALTWRKTQPGTTHTCQRQRIAEHRQCKA